jgi:hypothetical protein
MVAVVSAIMRMPMSPYYSRTIFAQPQFDQRGMLEEARWTVASQSCSMCETLSKAQRISALDREYRNALQELNTWLQVRFKHIAV